MRKVLVPILACFCILFFGNYAHSQVGVDLDLGPVDVSAGIGYPDYYYGNYPYYSSYPYYSNYYYGTYPSTTYYYDSYPRYRSYRYYNVDRYPYRHRPYRYNYYRYN